MSKLVLERMSAKVSAMPSSRPTGDFGDDTAVVRADQWQGDLRSGSGPIPRCLSTC